MAHQVDLLISSEREQSFLCERERERARNNKYEEFVTAYFIIV